MTALKCTDCGVTYPSRYYFADVASGTVCTGCAGLTPEQREQRRAASGTATSEVPAASASAQTQDSVHPLAALSLGVGALSVFLFPTRSIVAGLVAVALGVVASREIARTGGGGLKLARIGMILGCAMAGAWTLVLVVGRVVAALR